MSCVNNALFAFEDMVSKDALTRFEADNCLWSLQYKTSYMKTLCQVILEPSDLINPSYKNTAATSFRKVFTSRWIQSLNFHGELEDELKDLFRNEFYEILLSGVSEDIKSTLKQVVRDLHEEAWVEVWFLEELVQKAQFSDRIFLELLTNVTANYGNDDHDLASYEEVYRKLALLFASLMKKYLSSLPNHLPELEMLLKFPHG